MTDVFDVMADERAERHTFQVLTKRPERIRDWLTWVADHWPGDSPFNVTLEVLGRLPNVWMGTSVENARWRTRIDELRVVDVGAVRFLSCEPLLGPLGMLDLSGIGWVIVGGESGPNHRPIDAGWVREIRDQCVAAGVPFLFKQWGGRTSKSGGRELDGRTWDEYPEAVSA